MDDLLSAHQFELETLRIRLVLALAALALVVAMYRAGRARAVSLSILVGLAFASYASYYNFFRVQPGVRWKATDVYHYYMGSKYFDEVGYFDLYHCARQATSAGPYSTLERHRCLC